MTSPAIPVRSGVESAQTSLPQSDERLRLILDTAFDSFIAMNEEGAIIDWNRQSEITFGWSRVEALGRPLAETIIPPSYRPKHLCGLRTFLARGNGPVLNKRIEVTAMRRDGSEFPVEITIVPMRWEGTYLFHAFLHDITERKRMERAMAEQAQELVRSNEELERFASVASHDLQDPLRVVSGYLELLVKRYRDKLDDKANHWIHQALDGTARMRQLINDLLELSRVGTRGKPLAPTDCSAVFDKAVANLHQAIFESGAVVSRGELPLVQADVTQLTQVFQNLIGNAIKFHGPLPPEVRVAAKRKSGHWEFSVSDNGIGIDPQFAERIFVLFQRLHTRDEYPGTGIGLTVCKKVIDRHGGRIWVESQPGQGAVFYFTIPDRDEASYVAASPNP